MSYSPATGSNGYLFLCQREGLLCSKCTYQNTALSAMSKCILIGAQHCAPTNSELGVP